MHPLDFGSIKKCAIGGPLILHEDLAVVVQFDKNVFAADLNVTLKSSEAAASADKYLFLWNINDFRCVVAILDVQSEGVALLFADLVLNQGIDQAPFLADIPVLAAFEDGADMANFGVFLEREFKAGFPDRDLVVVAEPGFNDSALVYKCAIGAVHIKYVIDAVDALNLAMSGRHLVIGDQYVAFFPSNYSRVAAQLDGATS